MPIPILIGIFYSFYTMMDEYLEKSSMISEILVAKKAYLWYPCFNS